MPQVTIGKDIMHVDNTSITVDTTEDPFKEFGPNVDNLVGYTSFGDEGKRGEDKEKRDEKEERKNNEEEKEEILKRDFEKMKDN